MAMWKNASATKNGQEFATTDARDEEYQRPSASEEWDDDSDSCEGNYTGFFVRECDVVLFEIVYCLRGKP